MKTLPLLLVTIFLGVCPAAQANFVTIDNFAMPNPATFVIIGPATNPNVNVSPTGIGSTRTATYTVNVPTPPSNFDLIVQQGAGRLDFNSSVFARAQANLFYDNFTGGTGNFLANGTPFQLLFTFNTVDPGTDIGTGNPALNMPLDIAITTSGGTLTGSFLLSSTTATTVYVLPLSAFTGIADLANVTSVNITINAGPNQRQAVDYVLTNIGFETIVAPAPPAALIALAGLPVLGLIRRFRRS